ncbi:MAG: hypothetical protein Q8N67_02015 [Candidatus Omnitrophota bacterium]|nr:hypothetical protein [Candidatus Omnitrophota bacterium]
MRLKNIAISASVAVILLFSALGKGSFAGSAEIKSVMKIHRMGAYIILINYETHETWTDNLLFKVYCKFNEGDFTFTSATLNNISQGWHKTEIGISEVMKKRYGSLKEYKIELYCKGVLIDIKNGY